MPGLVAALEHLAAAIFRNQVTAGSLCTAEGGLAALQALLMAPTDCPVPARLAACHLICGLDDSALTPRELPFLPGCRPPTSLLHCAAIRCWAAA